MSAAPLTQQTAASPSPLVPGPRVVLDPVEKGVLGAPSASMRSSAFKNIEQVLLKLNEPVEKLFPEAKTEVELSHARYVLNVMREVIFKQLRRIAYSQEVRFTDPAFRRALDAALMMSDISAEIRPARLNHLLENAARLRDVYMQIDPSQASPSNPNFVRDFQSSMALVGLPKNVINAANGLITERDLEHESLKRAKDNAAARREDFIGYSEERQAQEIELAKQQVTQEIITNAPTLRAQLIQDYLTKPENKVRREADLKCLEILWEFKTLGSGNPFARDRRLVPFQLLAGASQSLLSVLEKLDPDKAAERRKDFDLLERVLQQHNIGRTEIERSGRPVLADMPYDYSISLVPWTGKPPRGQTNIDVLHTTLEGMHLLRQLVQLTQLRLEQIEAENEAHPMSADVLAKKRREAVERTWSIFHDLKGDLDSVVLQTVERSLVFGLDDEDPLSAAQLGALAIIQEQHRRENLAALEQRKGQQSQMWSDGFIEYPPTEWVRRGFAQACARRTIACGADLQALQQLSDEELRQAAAAIGDKDRERAQQVDAALTKQAALYQPLLTKFEHVGTAAHHSFIPNLEFDGALEKYTRDGQTHYKPTAVFDNHIMGRLIDVHNAFGELLSAQIQCTEKDQRLFAVVKYCDAHFQENRDYRSPVDLFTVLQLIVKKYSHLLPKPAPAAADPAAAQEEVEPPAQAEAS